MNLQALAEACSGIPHANLSQLLDFLKFCQLAKPLIEWSTKNLSTPPADLPLNACAILSRLIQEDLENTQAYWQALKAHVWQSSCLEASVSSDDVLRYNKEALPQGTSYRHLFPPTRVCLTPSCENHRGPEDSRIMTLTEPSTYSGTLFTLREGALPVFMTSLYCRGCHKRYYHNYWVHKQSSSRHYYSGIPHFIQASMHYFIDAPLLEFFGTGSVFGWLSSMNASRIYNVCMANRQSHILNNQHAYLHSSRVSNPPAPPWTHSLQLDEEFFLNGFFLYSLLLEKSEQSTTLFLAHDEQSQRLRLRDALLERNKETEGPGQEAYLHACDLCFFVFEGDDGGIYKVQAVVCNGDSIGFPCCAVHDCKEALVTLRDRFCHTHDQLKDQCAVTTCHELRKTGFHTCDKAPHRALELAYFEKGKSLLQLRKRLKTARGHSSNDNSPSHAMDAEGLDDLDEVIVELGECDGKAEAGNRTLKAYFGRRRTHNEQVIVRTCGVIVSRATLYGSEAVSGVNEFAKATFPTPQSTPEFFIFDNNCRLDLHQRSLGDHHFKDTAKPVDVFHFKSKHKLTDTHCQLHCNPASFPELIKDGGWRFNSSICEQVNVWLGKYQAILRDMDSVRFSFYLDEMIKRKNRYIIKQLEIQGYNPWTIPASAVFPSLFE